ncbi:MAG TPA: SHOCT domain-containing protein [Nitrospirae bacterium]|nr:incA protein [bacterium BMS3Abin06]HDH13297.1 SHOCT domain-containing protein [Nitrospirota bacterium]HDZ00637.1 SHOCT domain-containing protein [Nitrospirota bacterium]
MGQKAEHPLYKNISIAFLILIMHILLLGGIGVLILFFYGIINYTIWIILAGLCLAAGTAYWFYRRMKSDGRALRNMAGGSLLKGKTVEVSFLGGVATFKISDSKAGRTINRDTSSRIKQLAASDYENIKTLTELSRMYEKKLITSDEYNKAKQEILK